MHFLAIKRAGGWCESVLQRKKAVSFLSRVPEGKVRNYG